MQLESTTIKNPVTGADTHPSIVLPEGLIVKGAGLGASTVFKVDEGISFDHSGKYTAVGAFDYPLALDVAWRLLARIRPRLARAGVGEPHVAQAAGLVAGRDLNDERVFAPRQHLLLLP